jgi:hypothetical protein
MTKLCARGKAAAKRKFKVYPSAYANAYASKICAGKIKDPSGVKRKDFKGPKPAKKGAMIKANKGEDIRQTPSQKISEALKRPVGPDEKIGDIVREVKQKDVKVEGTLKKGTVKPGRVVPGKFDLGTLGKPQDISDIISKEKQKRKNISRTTLKEDLTKLKQKVDPRIDKAKNLAKKIKNVYSKVPNPVKQKTLGTAGRVALTAGAALLSKPVAIGVGAGLGAFGLYQAGKTAVDSLKNVYDQTKASQYRDEKKPTATFQKRSKKKQQLRDQKSEMFLKERKHKYDGPPDPYKDGGFSKVGNHDLMGSQLVGEIDGQSVSAKGSLKYYEDLF